MLRSSKKRVKKHQFDHIESNLTRRLSVAPTCYTASFAAACVNIKIEGVASIIHGISITGALPGSAELSIQQAIPSPTRQRQPTETPTLTIDQWLPPCSDSVQN